MSNTSLATQKSSELNLAGAQALVESVKDGMKLVSQGYLAITPDVAKLYDHKGFKALGYKNFDDMCTMEFGMSHGTTVGIRKVFDRFGAISKDNKYSIPEKYLEYGYTKLLLFTDKKFKEAGIDPIEEFTPDMTMAQMKDVLKLRLEEKAEKQDKEAIDTTATEEKSIIDNSTEEAQNTEEVQNTEEAQVLDPKTIATEIIELVTELQSMVELKPEKMVLFEAVIANMKEIKKLIK